MWVIGKIDFIMVRRRGYEVRIPLLRRKMSPEEYDQALLWLKELPGYRELIRQRIDHQQREIKRLDNNREARRDTDKLGREVEGCG